MSNRPLAGIERQTAAGKALWHFTMSPDGFVAGPNHATDWTTGFSSRPGLVEEHAETTGAALGGRDGFGAHPDVSGIHGGAWQGPVFVLTHRPDDARPTAGVTFPAHGRAPLVVRRDSPHAGSLPVDAVVRDGAP